MEDANFGEQDHRDAAAFSLTDFGAKLREKRLNISPLNVGARRPREDQFKRALVSTLHCRIVPQDSTEASAF